MNSEDFHTFKNNKLALAEIHDILPFHCPRLSTATDLNFMILTIPVSEILLILPNVNV